MKAEYKEREEFFKQRYGEDFGGYSHSQTNEKDTRKNQWDKFDKYTKRPKEEKKTYKTYEPDKNSPFHN